MDPAERESLLLAMNENTAKRNMEMDQGDWQHNIRAKELGSAKAELEQAYILLRVAQLKQQDGAELTEDEIPIKMPMEFSYRERAMRGESGINYGLAGKYDEAIRARLRDTSMDAEIMALNNKLSSCQDRVHKLENVEQLYATISKMKEDHQNEIDALNDKLNDMPIIHLLPASAVYQEHNKLKALWFAICNLFSRGKK